MVSGKITKIRPTIKWIFISAQVGHGPVKTHYCRRGIHPLSIATIPTFAKMQDCERESCTNHSPDHVNLNQSVQITSYLGEIRPLLLIRQSPELSQIERNQRGKTSLQRLCLGDSLSNKDLPPPK